MPNCIIIDDQEHAIQGLKGYIEKIPELQLLATYSVPLQALREISVMEGVDLILMDIDMPQIDGLQLAAALRNRTAKLIFTTSHTNYAYEAFEVDADGYLLKPYSFAKFAALVNKIFPERPKEQHRPDRHDDFFFVKDKNDSLKMVKVRYGDVVAIESQQNYVMIHTHNKKLLTYMSLSEMSKNFKDLPNFAQFQRSFVINKDHIDSISGNMIRMTNGTLITVGDHYRKEFNSFLEKNLLKAKPRA